MVLGISQNKPLILGLSHAQHWLDKVGQKLGIQSYLLKKTVFADQEIMITIPVSVRNRDVFLCQSTSPPANDTIMELLIAIDALKRASVKSISLVVPYFGYARQDRKAQGREPITAKLIASLISHFAITRLLTFDLHSPQIQGFFDVPIDHLTVLPSLLTTLLINNKITNYVLVAPDHGGYTRVKKLSEYLDVDVAIMGKKRVKPNQTTVNFLLGNVVDKNVVFVDDMIDTGGTLISCIHFLKTQKVKNIYVVATHGVLSQNALTKLTSLYQKGWLKKIVVSNSIPLSEPEKYPFLQVYPLVDHISAILQLIMEGGSISSYGKKQLQILEQQSND